jgi:hypothetical protein
MYSGKRHRCGFNIQVVGSAYGRLLLVGDPQPGAMHDARAWQESGLAAKFTGRLGADGFADTAYASTGLTTPRRKTPGQPRSQSEIEFNRAIASRRARAERVIAHVKNWKLLATGYRGLLDRFPIFLDTIVKLEIYRTS